MISTKNMIVLGDVDFVDAFLKARELEDLISDIKLGIIDCIDEETAKAMLQNIYDGLDKIVFHAFGALDNLAYYN